jgi:H+/gluconate symporter-like permease
MNTIWLAFIVGILIGIFAGIFFAGLLRMRKEKPMQHQPLCDLKASTFTKNIEKATGSHDHSSNPQVAKIHRPEKSLYVCNLCGRQIKIPITTHKILQENDRPLLCTQEDCLQHDGQMIFRANIIDLTG